MGQMLLWSAMGPLFQVADVFIPPLHTEMCYTLKQPCQSLSIIGPEIAPLEVLIDQSKAI